MTQKKIALIITGLIPMIILAGLYYSELEKNIVLRREMERFTTRNRLQFGIIGRNSQLIFGGERVVLEDTIIEGLEIVNSGRYEFNVFLNCTINPLKPKGTYGEYVETVDLFVVNCRFENCTVYGEIPSETNGFYNCTIEGCVLGGTQ